MSTFNWRLESLAKGIDPDLAEKEFKKIEKKFGKITPETVLEAARSRKALFHSLFEWEDSTAAEQYRLQQARTIINNIEITIISDGEEKAYPMFEIVPNDDGGRQYKNIESLSFNEIEYVKDQTLRTLIAAKTKLANYKTFDKVIEHIQEAVNELTEV
jgi:hypothetical protein